MPGLRFFFVIFAGGFALLAHPPTATAALLKGLEEIQGSIANLPYTSIPEIDPAVPAIVLCVAAVVFAHLRKRRV